MKLTRSEMMRYSRVLATIPLQYTCPGEGLIISHPEKGRHVRRQRQAWSRDDIRRLVGEGTATCLEREKVEGVFLAPCVHAVDDAVEPISEEKRRGVRRSRTFALGLRKRSARLSKSRCCWDILRVVHNVCPSIVPAPYLNRRSCSIDEKVRAPTRLPENSDHVSN
jgi:hypothetical protein